MASGAAPGDRPLSRSEGPQVLPGRRRVRLARADEAAGGRGLPVRDPAEGQRRPGAAHRPPNETSRGRPSKKPKVFYHAFRYRAKSWDRPRRVVAKVEWHAGELSPRVGFVVTDLRRSPKRVIKIYNGRGKAEQWIKEGRTP